MKVFLVSCLFVALFATAAFANDEEFTSFFDYLSSKWKVMRIFRGIDLIFLAFHSYYPNRVPPVPSVTLPTIFVADTDDSCRRIFVAFFQPANGFCSL